LEAYSSRVKAAVSPYHMGATNFSRLMTFVKLFVKQTEVACSALVSIGVTKVAQLIP